MSPYCTQYIMRANRRAAGYPLYPDFVMRRENLEKYAKITGFTVAP
jgi:hypothetical protein